MYSVRREGVLVNEFLLSFPREGVLARISRRAAGSVCALEIFSDEVGIECSTLSYPAVRVSQYCLLVPRLLLSSFESQYSRHPRSIPMTPRHVSHMRYTDEVTATTQHSKSYQNRTERPCTPALVPVQSSLQKGPRALIVLQQELSDCNVSLVSPIPGTPVYVRIASCGLNPTVRCSRSTRWLSG